MDKRTFNRIDRTLAIVLLAVVVLAAVGYGAVKFLALWRIAFG